MLLVSRRSLLICWASTTQTTSRLLQLVQLYTHRLIDLLASSRSCSRLHFCLFTRRTTTRKSVYYYLDYYVCTLDVFLVCLLQRVFQQLLLLLAKLSRAKENNIIIVVQQIVSSRSSDSLQSLLLLVVDSPQSCTLFQFYVCMHVCVQYVLQQFFSSR